MSYATVGAVESLNPIRAYTATSAPDLEDVEAFLLETSAVLDGILTARGFTLPVATTATSALELLAHYNAIGAWALVENAAASSPHKDAATKAWEQAQRMLRDGLIEPPGLTRDIGTTRARVGGSATPFFTRGMTL